MKLEALPAEKGDCMLLHFGSEADPKLALIDAGPAGVYTQTLKPRLLQIREQRIADGLQAEDDKLFIDLAVVSHVDDDHINGIKALLTDMASETHPAPFRIGRLWHNSFEKIVDVAEGQVASSASVHVTAGLEAEVDFSSEEDEARLATAMVLASIGQGHDVLRLAKKLGIRINPEFGGKAIEATDGSPLGADGLEFRFLGPLKSELDQLRDAFRDWLEKREKNVAGTGTFIASFEDKSVANLSSIVFLVEGEGKTFLLTGDARADKFAQAAKDFGLMGGDDRLAVDLFKVPHHGSDRNNAVSSFEAFPAPHYVFSGNGEHGNPERNTFQYLADARPGTELTVELTYVPAAIDLTREDVWNEKQEKKAHPKLFDVATQGIVPFFESHGDFKLIFPQ